jgi:hypothetical protein
MSLKIDIIKCFSLQDVLLFSDDSLLLVNIE